MRNKTRVILFLISAMLAGVLLWKWKGPMDFQDMLYGKEQYSQETEMTASDSKKQEGEDDGKSEVIKRDASDRRFLDMVGEYNETRYEDLITVRYSEEEMKLLQAYVESYLQDYRRINEYRMNQLYSALRGEYAFECIRETDRGGYVLFQGEDGSLLCVYFDKEGLVLRGVGVYDKFLSLKDYEGVIPYNIKEKELYALSGELFRERRPYGIGTQYCIVEEGTLVFYFRHIGVGWTKEDAANPLLIKRVFIPDGEEPPAGFEKIPQMLSIDKHIAEMSEETKSENGE